MNWGYEVVNAFTPHVLVLPEDAANRELANGFLLNPSVCERNIKLLAPSGGWRKVLVDFERCIPELRRFSERRIILLIDFDNSFESRSQFLLDKIPEDLRDRVFLLGTADEPERLRSELGQNFEGIGQSLAEQCDGDQQTSGLWNNSHLSHNQPELRRLQALVRPILFGAIRSQA